jgi:hypothetical protein
MKDVLSGPAPMCHESTDPSLDRHFICDNYATHKHPAVVRWLKRHPRFHVPFMPTSSSWLSLVERWFRDLTDKRIRRGVFKSVRDLVATIDEYVGRHNDQTEQGCRWTKSADQIIAMYHSAKAALEDSVWKDLGLRVPPLAIPEFLLLP